MLSLFNHSGAFIFLGDLESFFSVIRDAENVAMRGTRSTKFHLRVGQFKSETRACYQVISKTHPSESQCSVTHIGQFNVSVFIQIFGMSRDLMVELKLWAQSNLAEVWLKLRVIQNIIHFHLPSSGKAKQNHTSRNVDFPGMYFGAVTRTRCRWQLPILGSFYSRQTDTD